MSAPRPLRLVIGTLALAGLAKLGIAAAELAGGAPGTGASFFVTAAAAAPDPAPDNPDAAPGSAAQEAPAPGCAPLGGLPGGPLGAPPDEMLAIVLQERALLEDQRAGLDRRAAEIALANETLAIETARLDELKQEVEALLARSEAAHVADVDRLVSLYRNMKPRDAAAIMNDLDLEVTVTVLGTMAERNAAPILAALDPVRARALSLILLERSKLPGDRRLDRIRLD